MRVGLLLAIGVAIEVALLSTTVTDPVAMARAVLGVAVATRAAAVGAFALTRGRKPGP
ncbi:MAG TPA: hypothetical protein VFC31_08760 [Candidatus Limnocylindria bacterium]|nr:hypothetical protein [Candidatus Limnocylindria bacterium]